MPLISAGPGLLLDETGAVEHRRWLVVMSPAVFFRFPLFFLWFGHHIETLFTKRRVFGFCLISPLQRALFGPTKSPERKAKLGPLLLVVFVMVMCLVFRGVAIQKSLSILKISRILTKIS